MTDNNKSTEARISVLERDVNSIYSILGKLDSTTSRLTELTSDVRKMLAVHQEKIDYNTSRYHEYHEIGGKINHDIDRLADDIEQRYKDIEALISQIESESKDISEKKGDAYNTRLTNLERSRWLIAGGIAVIVFLGGLIASFFGVTL